MVILLIAVILAQIALIIGAAVFIFKYATLGLSEGYDVPLIETPYEYLPKIAEALQIQPRDIVYDLGSGDGRVIRYLAARFPGAQFVGIERNPLLAAYSRVRSWKVPNATFVPADFFKIDFADATRIYAYLMTAPLNELHKRGKLKHVRLVSRAFRLHGRPADATIEMSKTPGVHGEHLLHVYEL